MYQLSKQVQFDFSHPTMKFSSGHFSIFGSNEREFCHGHNFVLGVNCISEGLSNEQGIVVDYRLFKKFLIDLCKTLNGRFIIPGNNSFLSITEKQNHTHISFNEDRFVLPSSDVVILPIANSTLEELSGYFLKQILDNNTIVKTYSLKSMTVRVSTGPGQYAARTWNLP